ncbi:hypothetical protein [Hydrogenimonas sp.]
MKKEVDVVVVAVASPLLIGIYERGSLIERFESGEKTSDILPALFHDILYRYRVRSLRYARGPGSYMSIKIAYVFLKTLSLVLGIPLYAADAFAFNGERPIKAVGRSCFVKKEGEIVVESDCKKERGRFELPERLDREIFGTDIEPLYVLPAIQ